MDCNQIRKVHVVYKTHLDLGFTDFGENVIRRYVEEYIPRSLTLAEQLNTKEHKAFIWTLGSYLIDYYLKNAGEPEQRRLERAIANGDICWHGLACTTHTELMDHDLLRYNLSIGKKLDARFHRHTIAAKMTDVPGHTIALVDALYDSGIEYLHIGVNPSSMVPEVPSTFVWKHGAKSVIVQYSAQYGAPGYVEGMDEALEFAHTGDNLGPQCAEEIEKELKRIQSLYPNAVVEASTMDRYAESLRAFLPYLPVIEEEIGDTWIHGVASDPWKVGRYEELLRLKNHWKLEGRLTESTPGYDDFFTNLMLITEHTWGLDFKKYLADFKNWEKESFQRARKEDTTTLDFLTNRNAQMKEVLDTDIKNYRGGVFSGSYAQYESSHEEQRQYLRKAIAHLPEDLKKEAEDSLAGMKPVWLQTQGEEISIGQSVWISGWKVRVDGTGSVVTLSKDGKDWAKNGRLGHFSYETFNALNCVQNYYRYNRAFYQNGCWSEGDFSKPGLEFVEDLEHRHYDFYVKTMKRKENMLLISLSGDEGAHERYGCPAKAQIRYEFSEEEIKVRLSWFDKDANKMPEALWFSFEPDVENPFLWQMGKIGLSISPLSVARGGNRLQHCSPTLSYTGADGLALLQSLHAPLLSVGGQNLYDDYRSLPRPEKGFAWNLFNNKWGTNFKMWCEDDCRFDFVMRFSSR